MMNNGKASIVLQEGRLYVTGDLDFGTVVNLYQQSEPLLQRCKEFQIDLSGVSSCNSAGLALLLEWIKYGRRQQREVHFHKIPASLLAVATVAGVKELCRNDA